MVAGVILGIGVTKLWFLADVLLVLWTVKVHGIDRKPLKTHPAVIGLAVLVGITGFWSADPAAGPLLAVRVILTYSLLSVTPLRRFWWPVSFALAAGIVVSLLFQTEDVRFRGLGLTATDFGLSGLAVLGGPVAYLGAGVVGLAGSRSIILAVAILGVTRAIHWRVAVVAIAAAIMLIFIQDADRLTPAGFQRAVELRQMASDGEIPISDDTPTTGPEFRLFGYGYHGYNAATGLVRPHNVFTISWLEFGILAPAFWALIGWGAWRLGILRYALALGVAGMFMDDWFSLASSVYVSALIVSSVRRVTSNSLDRCLISSSAALYLSRSASARCSRS